MLTSAPAASMNALLEREFRKAESVRKTMLGYADGLTEDELSRRPGEDCWSVKHVIAHLLEAETLSLGSIEKEAAKKGELKKSGFRESFYSLLLKWALRSPKRFKAPARLKVEFPDRHYVELKEEWEVLRARMKKMLENFPPDALRACVFSHPFAGPMNIVQAIRFITEHIKHHQNQIYRTIEKVGDR